METEPVGRQVRIGDRHFDWPVAGVAQAWNKRSENQKQEKTHRLRPFR